jgi:hypothetical protein
VKNRGAKADQLLARVGWIDECAGWQWREAAPLHDLCCGCDEGQLPVCVLLVLSQLSAQCKWCHLCPSTLTVPTLVMPMYLCVCWLLCAG